MIEETQDDVNWFKIWVISTAVIFIIELYLDKRQLSKLNETERPECVAQYLDEKKFKKCQDYSRDKKKFGMCCMSKDFVFEISFWVLGIPPLIWSTTLPLSN